MPNHECKTHEEWLQNTHYMCPCGHVEWAHHKNGRCAHCNCTDYRGEKRPLTEHEKRYTDPNDVLLSELVDKQKENFKKLLNKE